MLRPDWVPAPAWKRLEAALRGQPEHARDLLSDLEAALSDRPRADRVRAIEAVCAHAEQGVPLPAAFISGLSDLLDRDG